MTTTGADIIQHAWTLLQDDGSRWDEPTVLGWLNQGRRMLVRTVPSRFIGRRVIQLAEGAEQQVPTDCAYFFSVWRNRGIDGVSLGATVRRVDRDSLEAFSPLWSTESETEVRDFAMADPEAPTYLVYPPVPSSPAVWVEVELAAWPTELSSSAQPIGMSERYDTALLYWLLHQAHAGDTEEGSAAKAKGYFEAFYAEAKGI